MDLKIKTFKEIVKQFNQAAKWIYDGSAYVGVGHGTYPEYKEVGVIRFSNLSFTSVAKMYNFCKVSTILTKGLSARKADIEQLIANLTDATGPYRTLEILDATFATEFKSLKLVPKDTPTHSRPDIIKVAPVEITEGNYTYRFLTGFSKTSFNHEVAIISRNDDNLYDYLDKGFYVMELPNVPAQKGRRFVAANNYDVNVAHIYAMCQVQPKLADMLQKGCFINSYDAELLRLKMHKKLTDDNKKKYAVVSDYIEVDYKKNTTLMVVGKLLSGEVEKTTVNNVLFKSTSASYERVSIEAADLLSTLYKDLNFNSEFDIYTLTSLYSNKVEAELNTIANDIIKAKNKEEVNPAQDTDEQKEQLEDELEVVVEKRALPVFSINGISITAAVSVTGQRYLNDIRINKDEIAQAVHRASCHHSEEEYKLFLKSISRMSIKWHDIIANGIQFKLQEHMTAAEYDNPEPDTRSPAIKFIIDKNDKQIKVVVSKDRAVRVNIGRFAQRAITINKRTNNKIYHPKHNEGWNYRVNRRDSEWCAAEVAKALIDCCTFKTKVKTEDGLEHDAVETTITKADIISLLEVANTQKKLMIARSREFLNTAVKLTGAVEIQFMGKAAYKVKGALREYAVIIHTAKVYDYETKQYRCIVNDRHYNGAGYDDIAARLLALKNDSVMQDKIGTLRGAAQPAAENVHDDALPDRAETGRVEAVIDRVLENK